MVFVITNGNTTTVKPTKTELKKFQEKMACLLETDKFNNSPETPVLELSSDEAIAELKKAKEKYELDLITKQEYEAIKAELKKYIK